MSKKDEPREVIMYEDDDGNDENGARIERISYGCPSCGKVVIPLADRCGECEQKLRW